MEPRRYGATGRSSRSRWLFVSSVKKPVLVGYAWTPGTYEEYMAQKVRDQVAMIRVLLGAGEWLGDSPETQSHVDKLEEYELDLSP